MRVMSCVSDMSEYSGKWMRESGIRGCALNTTYVHFFFTVGVGVEVVCLVFRLEFTFPVADVVVSEGATCN